MAIKGIIGLPSVGKTYLMVKMAKEAHEEGIPVYSNFKLGYEDESTPEGIFYWNELEQLEEIEKGLIIIDEPQVYMNARNWDKFSSAMQYKFQQHAKDGLNILFAVQHQDRIDTVVREIVQTWIRVDRYFGTERTSGFVFGLFKESRYDPEQLKKADGKPYYTEMHWYKPSVARWYNTLGKIEVPEQKDVVTVKFKRCATCGNLKRLGP